MKNTIFIILITIAFTSCTKNSAYITLKPTNNIQNTNFNIKTKKITAENKSETILEQSNIKQIEKQSKIKIAVIVPSMQIGKYAKEMINLVNCYSIYKNINISLKIFDIGTQTKENLEKSFKHLQDNNISNVIAMITSENFNLFNKININNDIKIYFPLINKNNLNQNLIKKPSYIFGAIDYKAQFEYLLNYIHYKNIVNFYDYSTLGTSLSNYLKKYKLIYEKRIDNRNGYYNRFLKHNKKLVNSNLILNTPIIKSSIILSQLDALDIKVSHILSTQINYTPLIFSLTQKTNRANEIIIANSIGYIPESLLEYSTLVGSDIRYNWVNYSTIIGLEYFINNNITIFKNISIKANQVVYPIELYKVGYYSFKKI